MERKEPTVLIAEDGTEYIIREGVLREKCLHQTTRDESSGRTTRIVCHDCGKVMRNYTEPERDTFQDTMETFKSYHGRYPRGEELSAMM